MTCALGVLTNMMPLLTMGGAWWPEVTPVETAHASLSLLTLLGVIWSSGL